MVDEVIILKNMEVSINTKITVFDDRPASGGQSFLQPPINVCVSRSRMVSVSRVAIQ